MKILVTGSCGYKGSVLVPKLLGKGYSVIALDIQWFGNFLKPHPNLEVVKADIRDIKTINLDGIDAIIHLSSVANDPCGDLDPKLTWEISALATMQLADKANRKGVKHFIFASSGSVYGVKEEEQVVEDLELDPISEYNKTKMVAERVIMSYSENLKVHCIRPATVCGYSPRMRFDLAINGMTYGAWKDRSLPLMRDGLQWRPMIHVSDTADAIIFMLHQDKELINGEIFNSGSPENVYQLRPLAERVAAVVGDDVKIEWYGDKDIRSYNVAFDKIRKLGFIAKHKAEDGVSEILLKLESGELDRTIKTITLDWYNEITKWHEIIKGLESDGRLLHD